MIRTGERTIGVQPHIRLANRPKWIKSVSTLRIEDKVKSSIIVAVEAND